MPGQAAARGLLFSMDSFFYRFRNPLVLIAIVLIQVIALAMQVKLPSKDAEAPVGARAMENAGAASGWEACVVAETVDGDGGVAGGDGGACDECEGAGGRGGTMLICCIRGSRMRS